MADFGAIWTPAALGNYDTSRLPVNLIVDHHTASTLQAAIARFTQQGSQVSAHFIVDRDGSRYYLVHVYNTAYHSGVYSTNQRSIGIEHVSLGPSGEVDNFTDAQYQSSAGLHAEIADYFGFPLNADHVWPHSRVVPTECPGSLDLTRLIQGGSMATLDDVYNLLSQVNTTTLGRIEQEIKDTNAITLLRMEQKVDAIAAAVAKLTPGGPTTLPVTGGTITLGG